QRLSALFVAFDDVVELEGIGLKIVQLRARRADVPVSLVGERRDRCPAEVIEAEHGFRIDRPWLQPSITLEHGLERSTAQVAGHGRPREIENRRNEIYLLDDVADAPACADAAGLLHDQRHPDRLVVHEESM